MDTSNLAPDINWVSKGAVTQVKSIGNNCRSQWAFASTGAVEGRIFINTNVLPTISEQQLIDCSGAYGNYGCSGGRMENSFNFFKNNDPLNSRDYPYTAFDGYCKQDSFKGVGKVTSWTHVPPNSVEQLQAALNLGPVAVALETDKPAFMNYKSGVILNSCGKSVNGAGLAVGYATDNDLGLYFVVKMPFGTNWGDQGYVRIGATADNICGILTDASYPN